MQKEAQCPLCTVQDPAGPLPLDAGIPGPPNSVARVGGAQAEASALTFLGPWLTPSLKWDSPSTAMRATV